MIKPATLALGFVLSSGCVSTATVLLLQGWLRGSRESKIEAREIRIVDEQGRVRLLAGLASDGNPVLVIAPQSRARYASGKRLAGTTLVIVPNPTKSKKVASSVMGKQNPSHLRK